MTVLLVFVTQASVTTGFKSQFGNRSTAHCGILKKAHLAFSIFLHRLKKKIVVGKLGLILLIIWYGSFTIKHKGKEQFFTSAEFTSFFLSSLWAACEVKKVGWGVRPRESLSCL